tara:strand:- start:83 stop:721 length:639 start_codon:yes stop_codon:yes gene_type:complete
MPNPDEILPVHFARPGTAWEKAARQMADVPNRAPNPDEILLKKFFDGWFIREWFNPRPRRAHEPHTARIYRDCRNVRGDVNDNGDLHTVPQISVNEYERYYTLSMKEKLNGGDPKRPLGVKGRDRMYGFIHEHIDKWQIVYDALCKRDGQVSHKLSENVIVWQIEDILESDFHAAECGDGALCPRCARSWPHRERAAGRRGAWYKKALKRFI